jgi:hypothetical protein
MPRVQEFLGRLLYLTLLEQVNLSGQLVLLCGDRIGSVTGCGAQASWKEVAFYETNVFIALTLDTALSQVSY